MAPGYVYDANTDSCIGLITSTGNYAEADEFCRKQNAHLFTIGREKLNRVAIDLLNDSGIKWAWINFENVVHEQKIKPHGLSGIIRHGTAFSDGFFFFLIFIFILWFRFDFRKRCSSSRSFLSGSRPMAKQFLQKLLGCEQLGPMGTVFLQERNHVGFMSGLSIRNLILILRI